MSKTTITHQSPGRHNAQSDRQSRQSDARRLPQRAYSIVATGDPQHLLKVAWRTPVGIES
jgi:hypothetical protein